MNHEDSIHSGFLCVSPAFGGVRVIAMLMPGGVVRARVVVRCRNVRHPKPVQLFSGKSYQETK